MKPSNIVYFILLVIISISSCKDDDMDPCDLEGLMPTSAAFTTAIELGWSDSIKRFESDTFISASEIFFTADQVADSYKWKIGNDPRVFDEKEFSLFFTETQGVVDIQLIVESEPNIECFPDDDGRDTISKQIYLVETSESLIWGKYRGVTMSNPNDTFTIDIYLAQPYEEYTNIDNFPNGCVRDEDNNIDFRPGYRNFALGNLGNYIDCPVPQGWGYMDFNNVIELEYSIYDHEIQKVKPERFIGIKIN